jgi:hypothetical protein
VSLTTRQPSAAAGSERSNNGLLAVVVGGLGDDAGLSDDAVVAASVSLDGDVSPIHGPVDALAVPGVALAGAVDRAAADVEVSAASSRQPASPANAVSKMKHQRTPTFIIIPLRLGDGRADPS